MQPQEGGERMSTENAAAEKYQKALDVVLASARDQADRISERDPDVATLIRGAAKIVELAEGRACVRRVSAMPDDKITLDDELVVRLRLDDAKRAPAPRTGAYVKFTRGCDHDVEPLPAYNTRRADVNPATQMMAMTVSMHPLVCPVCSTPWRRIAAPQEAREPRDIPTALDNLVRRWQAWAQEAVTFVHPASAIRAEHDQLRADTATVRLVAQQETREPASGDPSGAAPPIPTQGLVQVIAEYEDGTSATWSAAAWGACSGSGAEAVVREALDGDFCLGCPIHCNQCVAPTAPGAPEEGAGGS